MKELNKIVGERLADLRKDKGLQQKQLAKIIGVSDNTVSAYESGASRPSFERMVLIAEYFNVSVDYLLGLVNEEIPYKRENYIALPNEKTKEIKKEMLNQLDMLKLKYKIK